MSERVIELDRANIRHEEHLILKQVDLQIDKGEFIYLIGKVGSGKSSLLKTLYADLPLNEGRGIVGGFKLHQLKFKEIPLLRRNIGVVFQDFQLLNDRSVYSNLDFVLKATGWKKKEERKSRIEEVLTRVDMLHKDDKLPYALSGGEQQRIAIARAILNKPDIVLADEPTGNLDPETSLKLMQLLLEIQNDGTTVVMATHNFPILQKFPANALLCEDGKIKELK